MTEELSMDDPGRERVSKREFVSRVARRAGVPLQTANQVYDAIVGELIDIMSRGGRLTLKGLGRFYTHTHKGHRVRKIVGGHSVDAGKIDNYVTLKFTATRGLNKAIGERLMGQGSDSQGSQPKTP